MSQLQRDWCVFCSCLFDDFQVQWRRWLTGCQREAGLSWCHAHITLLSCWSTSHWAWCLEASLLPGGLLSFMCSLTKRWQHNFVMSIILANMKHTQGIGKHLYHLCCDQFLSLCVLLFHIWNSAVLKTQLDRCHRNFTSCTYTYRDNYKYKRGLYCTVQLWVNFKRGLTTSVFLISRTLSGWDAF